MTEVTTQSELAPQTEELRTRAELLADAVERWHDELLSLGGRDPLVHFRDLKIGTLDLASAEPEARKRILDATPTLLSKLYPHEPLRSSALRSVRAIRDKTRELAEERGIQTCFVALGIATWSNPFAAHRPTVPVLLRAATIVARDPAETDFVLTIAAEPLVNPALLRALDGQLGLRFTADDLRDPAGRLRYPSVVERLREFAPPHVVDGFSIAHRAVLSTFATEPMLLAADLTAFGVDLEQHDVVAALAEVPEARAAVRAGRHIERPEFLAFDADADQEGVVGAAAAGGHLLVDAPAGSGRTQTVAAIVAELVGRGKRVLVVGQKRVTLDDLVTRLRHAGLGDLVLDADAGTATETVEQVVETAHALAAGASVGDPSERDHDTSAQAATTLRDRLDGYLDALHRPREPWGSSAYDAMVAVASTPDEARSSLRLSADGLAKIESVDVLHARLREYLDLEGLTLTADGSPWFGAKVPTVEAADQLYRLVVDLRQRSAPALRDAATRAAVEVGLAGPTTLAGCFDVVELLTGVAQTSATFGPEIWAEPLDELVAATGTRATRAGTSHAPGFVAPGLLARRRLRARVRELGAGARLDRAAAHQHLVDARGQLTAWQELSRGARRPRTGSYLPAAVEAAEAAARRLETLLSAHPRTADFPQLSFAEVSARLDALMDDERQLRSLPRLHELEADIAAAGLDELIDSVRGGEPMTPQRLAAMLEHVRLASALGLWRASDSALRDFDVAGHEEAIEAFRLADAAGVRAGAGRVLAARAARFAEIADQVEGQAAVVAGWSEHSRPRTPHELLVAAPQVALAAVPCWVMSPLSVARVLPSRRLFDVVVVEDAGRVTVAQAVPAIARAARTILVGGDDVASTSFTTAVEPAPDPDEQEGPWAGGPPPSVVDLLREVVPTRALRGQYRVTDDRLLSFVAGSSFAGRMRPLPGVGGAPRVTVEVVETTETAADPVDSSSDEVARVVELALEHLRTRPHESLGVVTLGPRHAERVDAALRRALVRAPDVAGYLREDRAEPFFVKDVERVSGDVRDAIIVSLGYGRSVDGRILYRFGALGRPGGERRLAAAVTRARQRMTVVSTFTSDDLSPRRLTTPGAQALGEFLAHVESGRQPEALDAAPADPLALAIAARLRKAGISVEVGHGGRSGVPVAVRHPTRSDRFVLAVETDGHAYVSRGEARARDRLRRDQLARLGWSVHSVWSAAWAADPDGETARLLAAYEQAAKDADAYDWAVAAAEADVVAGMPDDEAEARSSSSSRSSARSSSTTSNETDGDSSDDAGDAAGDDAALEATSLPLRAGPRPAIPRGRALSDYTGRELAAVVRWYESDGLPRREAEVVGQVAHDLGLVVTDARTHDVLRHAVRVARAGAPAG